MSAASQALPAESTISGLFNTIVQKPLLALTAGVAFCLATHALTTAWFVLPMGEIGQALLSFDFSSLSPVSLEQLADGCHYHPDGSLHCLDQKPGAVDLTDELNLLA